MSAGTGNGPRGVLACVVALALTSAPVAVSAQSGEVVAIAPGSGPGGNVAVALALAEATDLGPVDTVVIARDDEFADALASGVLQAGAPLLLVPPQGPVPEEVKARLAALAPARVVILGGVNAVSPAVEAELAADYAVERREGATRLETAVAIAATDAPAATTAILSRAFASEGAADPTQAFADSLAAGGWAAAEGWPVLLTQTEQLSTSTADYLAASPISEVVIVGGAAAISGAVEQALRDLGLTVRRVAGDSRFSSAVAVAAARATTSGRVIVLEGQAPSSWAAGFAAAARSAALDAPIVLANGTMLPAATAEFLASLTGAEGDPARLTCVTDPTACEAAAEAAGIAPGPFALQAQIVADGPVAGELLGLAVDVSGDVLVAGGATLVDGRALVFERDGTGGWAQTAELLAEGDPDGEFEQFGTTAAVDGDTAVVGAPAGGNASVTVFQRAADGSWSLVQTIASPHVETQAPSFFGASLALEDGTLLVGASQADTAAGDASGAVNVYRQQPDGTFAASQQLNGTAPFVFFGVSVALDGDRAVVGTNPVNTFEVEERPNPAYVIERDAGGTWAIAAELEQAGQGRRFVGGVAAIAGDAIAIGHPDSEPGVGEAPQAEADGLVLVYRSVGGGWEGPSEVTASDGADGDGFGAGVAFLDGVLVVGAPQAGARGQVYAFEAEGAGWTEVAVAAAPTPKPPEGGTGTEEFGAALATDDSTLVVGAPRTTATVDFQGAVLAFTVS